MGKLTEFINEALIKYNPDKVFTHAAFITDADEIAKMVDSSKKDTRVAIAPNPNLTLEQQTKLSTDKVELVKQILCYNKKLDLDIAKKLVAEEVERITIISKYGEGHLNDLVVETIKKLKDNLRYKTVENLLNSPSLSDKTIEYVIKNHASMLTGTGARGLYRNKTLSKKAVFMLMDHLKNEDYHGDATLARLINNQVEHIKEADIKKLDWKTNPEVQEAISSRKDLSESFTLDMLKYLTKETHLGIENPFILTVDAVNTIMEKYISFGDLDYKQNLSIFENTTDLPLNPKLMIEIVNLMDRKRYSLYIRYILNNKFFPPYGLDEIEVDEENIKAIIASPAADSKRVEDLISRFVIEPKAAEGAIWGLAERKNKVELSKRSYDLLLNHVNSKSLWFEYAVYGKMVDEIVDNLDKYVKYFLDYSYKTSTPKDSILTSLSKNRGLTNKQRRKILDAFDKLAANEKLSYHDLAAPLAMNSLEADPEFFEDMMKRNDGDIWFVWDNLMGFSYSEFDDSIVKVIDKIALSTKEVTIRAIGQKSFDEWFAHTNYKAPKMSEDTAEKYLIHFIKKGNNTLVEKVSVTDFLSEKWKTPPVMMALYERTKDEKYLPQQAKDIFLF